MATQVAFSDLDSWLQAQPANTADTPYELEITGLTNNNCGESGYEGTLGYIINHNSSKYVDLSYTVMPETMVSLENRFSGCTNLIKSPVLPRQLTGNRGMYGCFYNCQSLKEAPELPEPAEGYNLNMTYAFYNCASLKYAPLLPNTITSMDFCFCGCHDLLMPPTVPLGAAYMESTFQACMSLLYKPILPSNLTRSTNCFSGVTQTLWGGTKEQILNYGWSSEARLVEKDDVEKKYVFASDVIHKMSASELDVWLQTQPANTKDTPYLIAGTESAFYVYLYRNALKNNPSKYVDFSFYLLPSETNYNSTFSNCTTLIKPPVLPSNITTLNNTFEGCTSLNEMPDFPSGITTMQYTFEGCTSLKEPVFPNSVTDITGCYKNCTSLEYKIWFPSSATTTNNCYNGVPTEIWKITESQVSDFKEGVPEDCCTQVYSNDCEIF